MDMAIAANFLVGSVLTMIGILVVTIGVVLINNIVAKYWKPIKLAVYHTSKEVEDLTTKKTSK